MIDGSVEGINFCPNSRLGRKVRRVKGLSGLLQMFCLSSSTVYTHFLQSAKEISSKKVLWLGYEVFIFSLSLPFYSMFI